MIQKSKYKPSPDYPNRKICDGQLEFTFDFDADELFNHGMEMH